MEPSGYQSKRDNPDLVSRPIVNRYRNARANNMYDDVSLQAFWDKVLGDKLAKSLDQNYRDMLSRPSKIAAWRVPHESDMADPNAQEVQLYPHFLALKAGADSGGRNKILVSNNAQLPSSIGGVNFPAPRRGLPGLPGLPGPPAPPMRRLPGPSGPPVLNFMNYPPLPAPMRRDIPPPPPSSGKSGGEDTDDEEEDDEVIVMVMVMV